MTTRKQPLTILGAPLRRFTLPNDTELRCTFRPLTTAEPCTSHFATCPDAKKWGKS